MKIIDKKAHQLLSPIPTRVVDYVHLIFSSLPLALPNQQERDLTFLVIDHIKKSRLPFLHLPMQWDFHLVSFAYAYHTTYTVRNK